VPKFNIVVDFSLTTEIEVEVDRHAFLDPSGVDAYEDDSYFQSASVESTGGNLKFQIEAEDADDAERQVEELIHDGQEIEDRNGLTWLTDSVSVDIEEVEEPMTVASATQTVLDYLRTTSVPTEVQEAIRFLLAASSTPFGS
jgi:hypothetical protein